MPVSRRSLPPLNALRAFEAAGRRLNFRAASDELAVTQGAVAQQIRLLEDRLGTALFQRVPRGVVLTPQGAAYHAEVTRAFDVLYDATTQLLARPDAITISVTPTFATKVLIPQLPALNAALPGIELRTIATETMSDFERDQVDIAVRLTQDSFPASIEAHLLFRQNLIAVASPLLIEESALPMTKEQLRKRPLLHDAHDHWSAYLGTSGKLPGPVFNQTTHALDAAMAGQGVALACRAFVQGDLDAGRLVALNPTGFEARNDYYLARKRSAAARPSLDALWDWCIANWSC